MAEPLSPPLLDFIRLCIPTLDAARVLLYIAANRGRFATAEEVATELQASALSAAAVKEHVALFARRGMVVDENGRFRYAAATTADRLVKELAECYNERPVSLVVAISKIAAGTLHL